MAVWVSGPDGNITFVNRQAEELLGVSAPESLGLPCHHVVRGVDSAGHPFCESECPVRCQTKAEGQATPVKFRIPCRNGRDRSMQAITMIVNTPEGVSLVHCAIAIDTADRAEEFVTKLASRTPNPRAGAEPPGASALTDRERQILALLAEDQNTHAIAADLHVSHATVRNHIQHIVAKLGAHSTMEAVARHLLSGD